MKTLKTILVRHNATVESRSSRKTKYAMAGVVAMLGVMSGISDASAYTCMKGFYRAGCVSRYGAVGVSRNGMVAVGRYGNTYADHRGSGCFWRNGQRICL